MSAVRFERLTILADDVPGMTAFLRVGLRLDVEEQQYAAFGGAGARLAVFSRPGMGANTHDHPDYRLPRSGQSFELNLGRDNPAGVRERLTIIVAHGGTVIADPADTTWGITPRSSPILRATSTPCSRSARDRPADHHTRRRDLTCTSPRPRYAR